MGNSHSNPPQNHPPNPSYPTTTYTPPTHLIYNNNTTNNINNNNNRNITSRSSSVIKTVNNAFFRETLPNLRELFQQVPEEIIMIEIFSFLPISDLPNLMLVSKEFESKLKEKDELFTIYYISRYGTQTSTEKLFSYSILKSYVELEIEIKEINRKAQELAMVCNFH